MIEIISYYILLALVGFLIGLLVISLGAGGGGGLFVPILIVVFGVEPSIAVVTTLVTIIPVTIIGSFGHFRDRNIDTKIGLIFGFGGIVGAIIGAKLSVLIPGIILSKILGIFLLSMGVFMILSKRNKKEDTSDIKSSTQNHLYKYKNFVIGIPIGMISGLMTSLFGSGGTSPVIGGLYILGYSATSIIGTSVFITMITATTAIIGHISFGHFDLLLTLFLCVGASCGALFGPKLLHKVKKKTLEKIFGPAFALIMFAMAILLIL